MSDDRDKPIIADWANHPGHGLMRQKLIDARNDFMVALARKLYTDPGSVTPEELRARSEFFKGAFWLLNQPVFARKEIERAMAQEGVDDV